MPVPITSLLSDLQRLVQEIIDENTKEESQALESETSTHELGTAPASNSSPDEKVPEVNDLTIKADDQAAGLVIGADADKNEALKLQQIEVIPEPDGGVRIMVRVKKEQHR